MHWIVTTALLCAACGGPDVFGVDEPKQQGKVDPMAERGAKSFKQRQKDCWDMPSAQACYDVGMRYEMGIAGEADAELALEYYDKACSLEKQKDHCEAAERMRGKAPQ